MSVEEHKSRANEVAALRCAVITVSDTRTLQTDKSGQEIVRLLEAQGHEVVERTLVPDDSEKIRLVLGHWLTTDVDAVLLNGGTGIARRDGTVEIVEALLDRELPGFGELFRYLSFKEVGAAAMLSRAVGGVASGKLVFSLPGAVNAVSLAMQRLILPELRHLVFEIRK
jgi:molybdenum cofactor biosynthesis protein B